MGEIIVAESEREVEEEPMTVDFDDSSDSEYEMISAITPKSLTNQHTIDEDISSDSDIEVNDSIVVNEDCSHIAMMKRQYTIKGDEELATENIFSREEAIPKKEKKS